MEEAKKVEGYGTSSEHFALELVRDGDPMGEYGIGPSDLHGDALAIVNANDFCNNTNVCLIYLGTQFRVQIDRTSEFTWKAKSK